MQQPPEIGAGLCQVSTARSAGPEKAGALGRGGTHLLQRHHCLPPPQGELISGRQACGERRSTLRGPWARRRKNGQGDTGQPQGTLGCTSVVQTGRPAARRCGAQCRSPRPRRPFGCPCPALISLLQGKLPLTQFPAPRRCPQRPDPCWLLSPVPELDRA